MDNLGNKKITQQRINAPEGMYDQTRVRIMKERIRIAKTRQQLAVGSALLLMIGCINVSIILFLSTEKPEKRNNSADQILYETYFDNQTPLSK